MAKSKWEEVSKRLEDIEAWASMGLSETQIAFNLGISRATLENYKRDHLDILESLKRGKNQANFKVENALYKKAVGYTIKEQGAIKIKEIYFDDKGNKCSREDVKVVDMFKEVPADVSAMKFWLINRMKGKWKDNPTKADIEKALLEMKKKQVEQGTW
ncbi:MAG: transposase [Clostridium cadaveris]|uniref:Transposase n=1 Tax=Clostridium cadaveris TaxID=1529 RepID=A0A316MA76_9CLOT|nr:transposase [Clostridium cadaveris]MDU4953627.1 hypothetical protein [Clostridium sp.]NWK11331.1 transposase [Clostridium cadaveris]PWL55377.1 MAG: transposase [Clostridium cadaveris]